MTLRECCAQAQALLEHHIPIVEARARGVSIADIAKWLSMSEAFVSWVLSTRWRELSEARRRRFALLRHERNRVNSALVRERRRAQGRCVACGRVKSAGSCQTCHPQVKAKRRAA